MQVKLKKRPRGGLINSYCRGAGSVLDIAPTARCGRIVPPRDSFNQRLGADFQRVGDALRIGIDTLQMETSPNVTRKIASAAG